MSSRFSSSSSLGKAQTRERWTSSIRFFPGWSIASFSGNLSWWLDTLPRPFRIVCSLFFWIRLLGNFFSWYSRLSPCGRLAITDTPPLKTRVSPPGEIHKEMTEINSRYYGLSLLRKCRHFHAPPPIPQRDILLFFFSRNKGHLSTSSKILTHMIKSDITTKENKQTVLQLDANMKWFLFAAGFCPVHEAALESFC